jgi:hypothetical protein
MAIIKRQTNAGEEMGGKRNFYTLLVVMLICTSTMEISVEFLQKAKIHLPYDPATPLLTIYLKKCKSIYKRDTDTPMYIIALFTIAKLWN